MGNLLTSSKRTVDMLVPICDVLATCGIKKDEANYFLSPKCLAIMHLLSDIEVVFMAKFLRHLGTDNDVIIDAFNESDNMVTALDNFKSLSFDSFINGINEDDNGNVCLSKTTSTGDHVLCLNYNHCPGRSGRAESKVEKIQRESTELKYKIIENIKDNIQQQNQKDTIVEFSSCFDMSHKINLEECTELLKNLHSIYRVSYTHHVTDEACGEFTDWDISVVYQPKTDCTR